MALTQVQGGMILPSTAITSPTLTSPTISGTYTAGTSLITSGTAVASTSGTSIDFTSIPSWVKRITVMFNGVSTNGANNYQLQLGTSGGVVTSGYAGSASYVSGTTSDNALFSQGLGVLSGSATNVFSGHLIFTNVSGNIWAGSSMLANSGVGSMFFSGTSITLSGTLDRVRITTTGGTDTFDAGSINILYE
jgi:hypothetical protein